MKKKLVLIIIAAVLATAAIGLIIFARTCTYTPEQISVTVAWNPGSITDYIVRVMASQENMGTQVSLRNIPGANGANGLNAVYNAPHDGTSLLSTSLSAFMAAEEMGFAQSAPNDWKWWSVAFSPTVIAVAADSPYTDYASVSALKQADVSAGINPAADAVLRGDADFIKVLSVEIIARIKSGEFRIIETFETGEYYGLFVPANTPSNRLKGLDKLINEFVSSDAFSVFLEEKGLV